MTAREIKMERMYALKEKIQMVDLRTPRIVIKVAGAHHCVWVIVAQLVLK
jgi:hypothetical protein